MKYDHSVFVKLRGDLHRAEQAEMRAHQKTEELTQSLGEIQTTVGDHFRELAKKYRYQFGYEKSLRISPDEHILDDPKRVGALQIRRGTGEMRADLPEGMVTIYDMDAGDLHKILEKKGIPHEVKHGGSRIELNIEVAAERLEEALAEHRPGRPGTWQERRGKRTGRQH
jgi:hypothetical protein